MDNELITDVDDVSADDATSVVTMTEELLIEEISIDGMCVVY